MIDSAESLKEIDPKDFSVHNGWFSKQSWENRGGLNLAGLKGCQAKIPKRLQNSLRMLSHKDGKWKILLRDSDLVIYHWNCGAWEMLKQAAPLNLIIKTAMQRVMKKVFRRI